MIRPVILALIVASLICPVSGQSSLALEPPQSAVAKAQHIVLLAGDEEYRSEEALPMLAKILSQRHGFKTTVLFSLNAEGFIDPNNRASLADSHVLDSADVIVMSLRFRAWNDEAMGRFVNAMNRGVPVVALRTSTHAFNFPPNSRWSGYTWNSTSPWPGGWGKEVLGETWVTHWGKHKVEATRGVPVAAGEALLNGVGEVFGTTDVYEVSLPQDARILMRGLVLKGMNPGDEPATHRKKRTADKIEQAVNEPAMPIVWTRGRTLENGKISKVFATTMGSATDLENEALRRIVVNAVYWAADLAVPAMADVSYVDPYFPLMYASNGYRTGIRVTDHAVGKTLPTGGRLPPAPAKAVKQKK